MAEETFQTKWGWFIWLDKLAGNSLVERNLWLDVTIVEFLNQISFITEKENEQQKKSNPEMFHQSRKQN